MNLKSGKVIKKPQNKNNEIKEEDDMISKLPDALLTHILSLIPEPDENRTRILSNRWKDLCTFLPNLHLVMPVCCSNEQVNKFHDSVDQTLALRDNMPIHRFFLYCSKKCDYNRVYDWLRIVVQCKVQQLELRFPADRYKVRFCWDLFKTCNTLVALSLKGNFVLDVPEDNLLFPCLKKLDLVSIVYSGDKSFASLITGCPVLEELFVERHQLYFDNVQIFKVSSPSLKKLRMSIAYNCLSFLLVFASAIDVPNLEYLYIEDKMSSVFSFTKMPSLVEAHMSTTGGAAELLSCLSSARTLTLTYSTLDLICSVHGILLCMFPNMVKLKIGVQSVLHWYLLIRVLLIDMPNLEHITFLDGLLLDSGGWDPPVVALYSLSFKIREITLLNKKTVKQEEFSFIRFLLEHSTNLETFTINAHQIEPEIREQILNFQRGSNKCLIEFI